MQSYAVVCIFHWRGTQPLTLKITISHRRHQISTTPLSSKPARDGSVCRGKLDLLLCIHNVPLQNLDPKLVQ